MLATYEDIEAEWQRLSAKLGPKCPLEAKAIMMAFLQHTSALEVKARCIYCGELLKVADRGTAWIVSCPCGRSKDVMKGL